MTKQFNKLMSLTSLLATLALSQAAFAGPRLEVGTTPFNGQTVASCMNRVVAMAQSWKNAQLTYSTDSVFASTANSSIMIVCNGSSNQAEIAVATTSTSWNSSQFVFNLRTQLW